MMDTSENITSNPRIAQGVETIGDIIEQRLSRRAVIGGLGAFALTGCATVGDSASSVTTAPAAAAKPFDFPELVRGLDETHHVAAGYRADVLIRWGDPLFADSPTFDPMAQTAEKQRRQFGYNNDFLGYVPLPKGDADERGLLCVNHEYTSTLIMFPGVAASYPQSMTEGACRTEMAAHGGSVVEVARRGETWSVVVDSKYNRRVTADTTLMTISGPAAGHPRMRTSADPAGRTVAGMFNNCAGGITPWGTWLSAEENVNLNFMGEVPLGHPETANHKRMGVPGGAYQWGRFDDRYNVAKEPNEPNRYGWIVEIDPLDPAAKPKKRTALGRFKHEGAETVIAPDGRVVLYMGDDQRFDYVYKFVTKARYNPNDRAANRDLLDDGTLYVARFDADGTVQWLPLVHGFGPLTLVNGFASQADVVIEARRAGDLLGATPMDRPEDVEPDPRSGRVWVMLTNNNRRKADQVNAANPRADNRFGHIIEIREPGGDFTATSSRWEILVRCGDPLNAAVGASWNPATSADGWFGSPDNCAIDPQGRLWVSTDGNDATGAADGLWALETEGAGRGTGRHFYRCPVGAELCGPRFTPGGNTLFVAVQHPGEGDEANPTSFENPSTRWPDFRPGMPPRPSIVAIRRGDGGSIGG
ncbi:MAG: PhoX family phosphatase [Sphingopyxis sp.]|nr:PhoX family phosphatase [Sphingopyxis sp.]